MTDISQANPSRYARPAPERVAEIRAQLDSVRYVEPYDVISMVAVWDLLGEIDALVAMRGRRADFVVSSHEGVDIVCGKCRRTTTFEEDRELLNLANYVAWADRHQCEVRG